MYNNKMTSEVSGGAKDSENNSIIESEILDEVESESGSVSIEERTDVVTPSVKETVSEVTENYSEEFENYNDDEEEEEQIEESVVESDKEVTVEEEEENTVASSSKSSSSSSDSIKIRCEINISNSAIKSDQESVEADNPQFTMEDEIRSWTPSDYNDESHLFDMGVLNESMVNLLLMEDRKMQRERQRMKYKNGTRMSLSFTNERMREIERHNQILVRKIFQAATPQVMSASRNKRRRGEEEKADEQRKQSCRGRRESTSAVNRKKQQRQIGLDNEVLVRKIKQISGRKKKFFE